MEIKTGNINNRIFFTFLFAVIVVFFYLRPLKSPWHPFIAGDGLGYYSYLPAIFIYHDKDLDFKWFNKTYNANYVYSTFKNPEDNLLVQYKNKRINKYYQGLSFIWMPFFFVAHLAAKLLHYPADGFSLPYQWMIGLASLFYLLIGLFFLHKLLLSLFESQWIANLVPILIYFGTHLFNFSIFANSLSHVYSFSINILIFYFFYKTVNAKKHFEINLMIFVLLYLVTICVRPLNGIIVFALPFFIHKQFDWHGLKLKMNLFSSFLLLLVLLLVFYQCKLMYIQTGSFLPYTYTNEHFNFTQSKFIEALWSYHIGLLFYIPLVFFSLLPTFFLGQKKYFYMSLFFLGILFLYSSWWYWPIVRRAMIDFYVIPAILLGLILSSIRFKGGLFLAILLLLVSVVVYQLKDYQIRNGILSEFSTYKEVYWRNFFRTNKANMYLIPPETIVSQENHFVDFEITNQQNGFSQLKQHTGKTSRLIDAKNYFCQLTEYPYPQNFTKAGIKKIRFSFYCYFSDSITTTHLFIQFFNKAHESVLDVPFYLGKEDIFKNQWDLKEFGYEITDSTLINKEKVDKIGITIWNVEAKKSIYIDDLKVEFLTTNRSFETIQ